MSTYCKPLKRGVSWRSQNFGESSTVYGPHSGNDEACNVGTPVHAAGDGVIEWAGEFDDSYADNLLWLLRMGGNVAVLNCGDNEPSFVYAHLSAFYVRPGERVVKGQVIALSGNSGTATTGAHLHVEAVPPGYVLASKLLGRANPDTYLTEWPEDVKVKGTTKATTGMDDEMLIIARKKGTDEIFIGDHIMRRHIPDVKTLNDIKWSAEHWGTPNLFDGGKIQDVENVEFIGKLI